LARKSTKAELIKRREEVQDLILAGYMPSDISSIISEKYGVKKRVVSDDIKEVGKAWEAKADESKQLSRNKFLDRLEHMFQVALANGNIKNALEIQKEINKISGLYQEVKSENTTPQFITLKAREPLSVVPKASGNDEK
jgi:predicted DNA-binding protein YlxM (UPF0122 family)